MSYERKNGNDGPGWLDVHAYLESLRRTTGRRWCVCMAATSEESRTRHLLLSVCEFRGGTPIVRDDLVLVTGHWPNPNQRYLDASVYELLYRFDALLAERESASVAQQAF